MFNWFSLMSTNLDDWKGEFFYLEDKEHSAEKVWRQRIEGIAGSRSMPRSLKDFAEVSNVIEMAVSKRSKSIEIVQKQGNWVPYQLKARDTKRRFFTRELLI